MNEVGKKEIKRMKRRRKPRKEAKGEMPMKIYITK